MDKQFCTYEIASQLKELGFNEPCLKMTLLAVGIGKAKESGILHNPIKNSEGETIVTHPLWQQVIDWLREKHQIDISNNCHYKVNGGVAGYLFDISNAYDKFKSVGAEDDDFYKAREKSILKALELIKEGVAK